ncbi:MAG: hypothetical protein AAFR58_11400 [Cyanobacteria bacterium J06627_28]
MVNSLPTTDEQDTNELNGAALGPDNEASPEEININSANVAGANVAGTDHLEKIRDILFGQQVSTHEQRFTQIEQHFEQIEQRLTDSYRNLSHELHRRLDTIEKALTSRLNQLEDRLSAAEAQQSSSHQTLRSSIDALNQKLDVSMAAIEERNRQHVDERSHAISEEAKQQSSIQEQGLQLVAESAQQNRQAIAEHAIKLETHSETLNTQAMAFQTHEEQLKGTLQTLKSEASQQTNNLKEAIEQQMQSYSAQLKTEVLLRKQSEQAKREQLCDLVEGLAYRLREGLPQEN